MTDDESRKAFELAMAAPPYERHCKRFSADAGWPGHYRDYCTQLAWDAWQAAVEWATQRAMERCAALCRKARDEQQLLLEVPIDVSERWEVAEECALLIEQELTP